MKKSLKEFFPRLIFSLFFVYVLLLGVFNLLIASNKTFIENYLANILEADSVKIGNISNLPFIFISGTDFTIVINDELSLKIEGVYFQYRFYKIFTKEYEQLVRDIQVEKITFNGHSVELKKYISKLQKKFPSENVQPDIDTDVDMNNILSKLNFQIFVRQISIKINSMLEFWHSALANNVNIQFQNQTLTWDTQVKINSIWSNRVFLAEATVASKGSISNFSSLNGNIETSIKTFNLGGLPIVQKPTVIQVSLSNNTPFVKLDPKISNNIFISTNNGFNLAFNSSIDIVYKDFEEYYFLDYAFKPGKWNFKLNLEKQKDWKANVSFSSPQHPTYGLDLKLDSITPNKMYSVVLDLKTHFFGNLKGDLFVPIRKGLYPLPGGSLYLDNVRFVLDGLIFSGTAIADVVPNKNAIDISLFNVAMNGGLIGNTSATFSFPPGGAFVITPRDLINKAVDVSAYIGSNVVVGIKGYDIDGDFIAKNIKIPIFGIQDSRYRGKIDLSKQDRKSKLYLDGYLKGYLDEEEQIDAIISLADNDISVPRFHIISPDILLSGNVLINSQWSNTTVAINATGSYNSNELMPIDLLVDIQKRKVTVSGTVDETIDISTETIGTNTDFTAIFPKYTLTKLGFPSTELDTTLQMQFDEEGVVRFALQDTKIYLSNRSFTLNIDSYLNTNTGMLDTTLFRIGMDTEVLDGFGYLSFANQFGGSFRFRNGGSFQFNIGRYIVKSKINLVNFNIEDIFTIPALSPVAFLNHSSTESTILNTDLDIIGTWDNLAFSGNIFLQGLSSTYFMVAIPEFKYTKQQIALNNLRLRHPNLNIDSNIKIDINETNISTLLNGSFAYQNNLVKTDFNINYQRSADNGVLTYQLPNLYVLSEKPLNLKGKLYHTRDDYVFLSDNSKYGLAGSISRITNINTWDISILSDSLRLFSKGTLNTNDNLLASFNIDVLLDKITPSGDIRSTKGDIQIRSTVSGVLEDPIVNGAINFNNIDIALRSLQNRIQIKDSQSITISNNQLTIPDLTITARGGGDFGLDGLISYQNQTIETANLNFYSKTTNNGNDISFLSWNIDAPFIRTRGRTYISNITLARDNSEFFLNANIETENINLGLELEDTLNSNTEIQEGNLLLAVLDTVNLDINVDFNNRSRFSSQLFDLNFEQVNPVRIQGNLGTGDLAIAGDFNIDRGKLSYLNTDLNVTSGSISFSEEVGDLFPSITINSEIAQSSQDDLIDIYVNFDGKLPNVELASISSSPSRTRSELLALLGRGTPAGNNRNQNNNNNNINSSQDLVASSVGIAENTLLTSQINRRVQRLIPFIDNIELRTDILGNITRGQSTGGLGLLNGTELSVGQYLPGIKGLQASYNLRLESPNNNTGIDIGSINQIHQFGFSINRIIPRINWQIGVGGNFRRQVTPNQNNNQEDEFLGEISLRNRF